MKLRTNIKNGLLTGWRLNAIAFGLVLTGCGNPQPAPKPPAAPPPPPAIGAYLEDASPGKKLYEVPNPQDVFRAMQQSLVGYGNANVTKDLQLNYVIDYADSAQGPKLKRLSETPAPQGAPLTYQLRTNENMDVQLISNYDGRSGSYSFTDRIDLDQGVVLYSTDEVALFTGAGRGGLEILRIAFKPANPIIQRFTIQSYAGNAPYAPMQWNPNFGAGMAGVYYQVAQKEFAATFTYRPYQQAPGQPQQPQQPQQPNGPYAPSGPFYPYY